MKLNRNNYEEYFILYLDNELDSESRREVESFAKQNPDLAAELELLKQSKLTPDADILFSEKGSLMRFDSASISLSNYEEWLTAYIDNELTKGERKDVEVFVAGNPSIQRQLNLLQQTKLQPETIIFPYKESLYRKEEKARVVPMRWWRIAAAAVLLIGVSTTAVVLINGKGSTGPDESIVSKKIETKTPGKPENRVTPSQTVEERATTDAAPVIASTATEKKNNTSGKQQPDLAVKKIIVEPEVNKEQPEVPKEEKPLIAKENPNNLPERIEPNKVDRVIKEEAVAAISTTNTPKEEGLTDNGSLKTASLVTPETDHPSYAVEKQSGNKGIRGLLRKVTRTFEKRTNIKATDEDDRLLIAGLAIKL